MSRATRYTTPVHSLMATVFAQRLAADGDTGDQRRHGDGDKNGGSAQVPLQLHHDDSRRGAADDAADVAHHVVAEGADLIGVFQQTDGLLGALFLVGRHGVEGLGVGGGDGHADHIKHDAEGDEHRQHDDGHGVAGPLQRSGGEKAQQRRQRHRQQKDPQRPAAAAFLLVLTLALSLISIGFIAFAQRNIPLFALQKYRCFIRKY